MIKDRKPRFFYGYVVVVAAFLILVVMWGTFYSFGVFFKPLLTEFGFLRFKSECCVLKNVVHTVFVLAHSYDFFMCGVPEYVRWIFDSLNKNVLLNDTGALDSDGSHVEVVGHELTRFGMYNAVKSLERYIDKILTEFGLASHKSMVEESRTAY